MGFLATCCEIIDGDQLPVEPEMLSSPSPIAMRKSNLSLLYPPYKNVKYLESNVNFDLDFSLCL